MSLHNCTYLCIFLYLLKRKSDRDIREGDVEVKRARDIFTSARSWLPTALQVLPYKDNRGDEEDDDDDDEGKIFEIVLFRNTLSRGKGGFELFKSPATKRV